MCRPSSHKSTHTHPYATSLTISSSTNLTDLGQAKVILLRASDLLKASLAHLDFKRPDDAWVKYIAASQILLYIVPRNKEYPTFRAGNGALNQQYNDLLLVCSPILSGAFEADARLESQKV